jgi:hypothetical protein
VWNGVLSCIVALQTQRSVFSQTRCGVGLSTVHPLSSIFAGTTVPAQLHSELSAGLTAARDRFVAARDFNQIPPARKGVLPMLIKLALRETG